MGGAETTTTVDLSTAYTKWTKMNLALNGLSLDKHAVVQGDCAAWLRESKGTFDMIFVDPPTFSNTKKERRVFDVQREHVGLIVLAMSRLDTSGVLFFSTNYKRFVLDARLRDLFDARDISKTTVPFDFSRSRKIHMCWEIKKRKVERQKEEEGE